MNINKRLLFKERQLLIEIFINQKESFTFN